MALQRRCAVRFLFLILASIIAIGFAGSGFAKEPAQPKGSEEEKYKEFVFDKEEVTGEVLKPDQSVTGVVGRRSRDTLIRERADFRDEILKSVEDL